MQWEAGRVLEAKHWNERLCSLKVEVNQPEFEAGQFIRVGLPDTEGDMEARPYSFVNAPDEAALEIYFNRVEVGSLSKRLFALQTGDEVFIADRPAGFMIMSEVPRGRELWMLATGTALGPFLSMLKTPSPWQQFEKVVLVHGVRSADELSYQDVLDSLEASHPQQLIRLASVTRENLDGALNERIPNAIRSGALEDIAGISFDARNSRVMLCGNPGMVQESFVALEAKGLRKHLRREPGQVLQEIYK